MGKVTSEIRSMCDKYSDNEFVISSRPTEEFIGWNDFSEMTSLEEKEFEKISERYQKMEDIT